jgi:hypothetical protein
MTMTAMIVNPYKATFAVSNWFDALVGRVLPQVREYISEHAYEDIIGDHSVQLDKDVFKALEGAGPNGGKSIISILKEQYGIELVALETVDINPPPEYRKDTIATWLATKAADRAVGETAGRIKQAVAVELGMSVQELDQQLKDPSFLSSPAYQNALAFAKDMVKRDRAGVKDIRIGSTDSTPFGRGTVAELAGGFAAAFAARDNSGSAGGRRDRQDPDNQGEDDSSQEGGRRKERRDNLRKITQKIEDNMDRGKG